MTAAGRSPGGSGACERAIAGPNWRADGIAASDAEIIADETSRCILAGLSAGVAGLYP